MKTGLQEVAQGPSLVAKMASRFGVEPNKMLTTLKATAFKGEVSNEQMMALLIVADQYSLNPWVKEIYAFPDKGGGIVPVVGVDGWARIINSSREFDGMEFADGPEVEGLPAWIECVIYRKDRAHPIRVREYMKECKRATGPWTSHPRRLLRHKAMIQCARVAFGFVGIYDEDEAQRIIEGSVSLVPESAAIGNINKAIKGNGGGQTIDAEPASSAPATEPDQPIEDHQHPGLSYAEIATAIGKAETAADFDLCGDLIRSVPDDSQRDELDAELAARRAALAEKRKKL